MICFRPVQSDDFKALHALIKKRPQGMTTLPHTEKDLRKRIDQTVSSFVHPEKAGEHYYWFLLEDASKKSLLGVSAILTPEGHQKPFYTYHCQPYRRASEGQHIAHEGVLLEFSTALGGLSELCTLLLNPRSVQKGLGTFLSRARFLFIAAFPDLFTSTIIAEIRGITDKKGVSPFWNAVGKHFFHLPFEKADLLSYTDKRFIHDLMPKSAIEMDMLPSPAQAVIAKPHPNSKAALHILENEGFQFSNHIDIFDGGPLVSAHAHAINTVQHSHTLPVQIGEVKGKTLPVMLANTQRKTFRATQAEVQINTHHDKIMLPPKVAALLKVEAEEPVRYALY